MTMTYVKELDFIPAAEAGTLPGLFAARVQRSPDSIAYQQYDSQTDSWRDYRWKEIQALVAS